MSSDVPEAPDGFKTADAPQTSGDDFDTEGWVDRPSVGEFVQGVLIAAKPDRGEYEQTCLEIKLTEDTAEFDAGTLVAMMATSGIDGSLEAADAAPGDEIFIAGKDTFENDDGKVCTNYSVAVREE